MEAEKRAIGLLGIAKKAGLLMSGEFSTEKAIKSGVAELVIVAGDASANTKKHFSDMCAYRNLPYVEFAMKTQLGSALGKEVRASMALTDEKIAKSFLKLLGQ